MAEADAFSIVVIGAMNSAIHHPYWYRDRGLIDDEEMKTALSHEETVFVPEIAQFNTGQIFINCQARRWEVKTSNRGFVKRIVDIAGKVFDEILPHTPIVACGFNFIFPRSLNGDARRAIANTLKRCPIDFGMPIESAEIKLQYNRDENCLDSTLIAPLPNSVVRLATNINFGFEKQSGEPGTLFSLKDTLSKFGVTLSEVEARANKLIDQLRTYAAD
jgi:hypothetical protein